MIISIYDMDRTVTRRGTWLPWLSFWLRTEAPWRVVLLPLLAIAGVAYALKLIDRGRLKSLGQQLVMGRAVPRARVVAAAAAFAEAIVTDDVFPDAIVTFAAARATGQRLVIATASNHFYVDAIAARLGFDAVIATRSYWRGDMLAPGIEGLNCYGEAKRAMVSQWLAEHGASDAELRFYSDHLSDMPSFEMIEAHGGIAVAVNPSPALRAEATRRGWEIVDWGATEKTWFERA